MIDYQTHLFLVITAIEEKKNNNILKSTGPNNERNRNTDANKPIEVSIISSQSENKHKLKQDRKISETSRGNGELRKMKPTG